MKALWLCSWYPNSFNPNDGDFVQRHAFATAKFLPVTVFYVGQYGENADTNEDKIVESERNGVKEKIIFFKFKKKTMPKVLIIISHFNGVNGVFF